jgi:hypothetical protein
MPDYDILVKIEVDGCKVVLKSIVLVLGKPRYLATIQGLG